MQQQQVQPQFTFEGGHLVMFHKEATGLPQVKDANVNDRDRMNDLLATEKYMTTGYNISMNEASHDALFQVLKQNHDNIAQLQRQAFNTMFKKGWYKLPVADAQSVSQAYNQFQQYQTQFPFPANVGQPTGTRAPNPTITQAMQQARQQAQAQATSAQATSARATAQRTTGTQWAQTAGRQDQQLTQKVDQAIREAERGQVPTGYAGQTH